MEIVSTAIISISAVVVGALLNEWLRRSSRLDNLSISVFAKRIEVYDELYKRIYSSEKIARDIIETTDVSLEEKFVVENEIVWGLLEFCEKNNMWLSEEASMQCMTVFMDISKVKLPDGEDVSESLESYERHLKQTKAVLIEDSGIKRVNEKFGDFIKPTLSSDVLEYYQEKKRERDLQN